MATIKKEADHMKKSEIVEIHDKFVYNSTAFSGIAIKAIIYGIYDRIACTEFYYSMIEDKRHDIPHILKIYDDDTGRSCYFKLRGVKYYLDEFMATGY